MTDFPLHTIESAPERSKAALQQLQAALGMIPNLVAAMATSPVLIDGLVGLFQKSARRQLYGSASPNRFAH
jgi:hypothetical protein